MTSVPGTDDWCVNLQKCIPLQVFLRDDTKVFHFMRNIRNLINCNMF